MIDIEKKAHDAALTAQALVDKLNVEAKARAAKAQAEAEKAEVKVRQAADPRDPPGAVDDVGDLFETD